MEIKKYYSSVNILRIVLVACLILCNYSLVQTGVFSFSFLLNFAGGALFMLYGFLALGEGADLKKRLKRTAISFAILFVVYLLLATGYLWLLYRQPFAYFTKRGICEFLVLNYWGPKMGTTIWFMQSQLYALIVLYVLRRFKRFDWLLCILTFILGIALGEGSGLIHFNIFGYTYCPGNFVTRALPYMLLGRILSRHEEQLCRVRSIWYWAAIAVGIALSVGEVIGLAYLGALEYVNHLAGFILMSFGVCMLAVRRPDSPIIIEEQQYFNDWAQPVYRVMYYLYNPIAETAMVFLSLLALSQEQSYLMALTFGICVALLCLVIALAAAGIRYARRAVRPLSELRSIIAQQTEARALQKAQEEEMRESGEMPTREEQAAYRREDRREALARRKHRFRKDLYNMGEPFVALWWSLYGPIREAIDRRKRRKNMEQEMYDETDL